MLSRLAALVLALLMVSTAFARLGGGVRCVSTGRVMTMPRPCCQHGDGATTSVRAVCCEPIAAIGARDLRALSAADELQLVSPVVIAYLAPTIPNASSLTHARCPLALACAQAPGERLHRLISVLRI